MVLHEQERMFMISGEDENGDHHLFMTENLERAVAQYRVMKKTLRNVSGNDGFEELARPLID